MTLVFKPPNFSRLCTTAETQQAACQKSNPGEACGFLIAAARSSRHSAPRLFVCLGLQKSSLGWRGTEAPPVLPCWQLPCLGQLSRCHPPGPLIGCSQRLITNADAASAILSTWRRNLLSPPPSPPLGCK